MIAIKRGVFNAFGSHRRGELLQGASERQRICFIAKLSTFFAAFIFAGVSGRFGHHTIDIFFGEIRAGGDRDLLLFLARQILSTDIHDAVGVDGEKDGALVSLEKGLRYCRAFTSNSDEATVLPLFAFVAAVVWYAINPFRPKNT